MSKNGPVIHTRYAPPAKKDANGAYLPPEPEQPEPEPSIDGLMKTGLMAIQRTVNDLFARSKLGTLSRNDVATLKDCMTMLHELKEFEKDLLDEMDDEEIEKIAK